MLNTAYQENMFFLHVFNVLCVFETSLKLGDRWPIGAGGRVKCRLDRQNGATAVTWPCQRHPSSLHASYAPDENFVMMIALIRHGLLLAFQS